MWAVPPSRHGYFIALFSSCRSGYEGHRGLNVPSPPILAYYTHKIVEKTAFFKAIREAAFSEFCIQMIASFLACARDCPTAHGTDGVSIRRWSSARVFFPLPPCIVEPVDDLALLHLVDDLPLLSCL